MADDYEIGYGRPPRKTQFKSGTSGNPEGRPKGSKNLKTDLQEELQEKVRVTEGTREKVVSKQRAFVKSMTARALKGDPRAIAALSNLVLRLLPQEDDGGPARAMAGDDQAILDAFADHLRDQDELAKGGDEP